MPDLAGSIRFRLTVIYSLVLFGLAAAVVGGIYLGVSARLADEPISREIIFRGVTEAGEVVEVPFTETAQLEEQANQRALDQLRNYSIAALILLFLASLGVGWIVAGRVLAPIGRITGVAREIQATDLTRRIRLGGPRDELRALADTFDDMLARLEEAFESQRRFVHEASHELRNPLAVMRTNLDVTMSDPDASAEELRRTAAVLRNSTERMSHLVDDLLMFARHETPTLEHEPVEVGPVVHGVAAEFEAPAEARRLDLETTAEADLWVVGDRQALRQALANLLANAVRLAPTGSRIRVGAGSDGGWVWMAVEDQGPGVPAEEQAKIFQRFYRGDAALGPRGVEERARSRHRPPGRRGPRR
ncbi:MAG: histidine kinase dimerization/phospho-acceptor domain-containing protein [Acidimicrobiia bacterium]|nr:histidine kinase dimerization/phospho-acceptor domain-containing protein [Acidimicrobiia bacterium]